MSNILITGEIKKYGVKDGQYPSLWILLDLDAIPYTKDGSNYYLQPNQFFLSYFLETKDGFSKRNEKAKIDSLVNNKFCFINGLTLKEAKFKRKQDDGSYKESIEIAASSKLKDLNVSNTRFTPINYGTVEGTVKSQNGYKILLEEKYKGLKGEVKTRDIPIFAPILPNNITGQNVVFTVSCSGIDPSGNKQLILVADNFFVIR